MIPSISNTNKKVIFWMYLIRIFNTLITQIIVITITAKISNTRNIFFHTIITINIVDDLLDEIDETVIVTLSNPNNATLGSNIIHTYTINDNEEAPGIGFEVTSSSNDESVSSQSLQKLNLGLKKINRKFKGASLDGKTIDIELHPGHNRDSEIHQIYDLLNY